MYASLVDGTYDCVDRIVLNAYFRFAQSPAGFRLWWRQLYGTDDDLDNAHLIANGRTIPASFACLESRQQHPCQKL